MARIKFEGVTRRFPGAPEPAVAQIDLDVSDGEVVVLTGPSGSGKTTLLRLAAGLELPDEGRVVIGDDPGTGPAAAEVALVFQNYAIYPNLSVRENIAVPLRHSKVSNKDLGATVDDVVGLLGLGDRVKQSASSLTTSERMRVALARSLARRPDVLLMDEPLANLEPGVRAELRDQLVVAQQAFGATTLYATGAPDEIPASVKRIVRLEGGQMSTP